MMALASTVQWRNVIRLLACLAAAVSCGALVLIFMAGTASSGFLLRNVGAPWVVTLMLSAIAMGATFLDRSKRKPLHGVRLEAVLPDLSHELQALLRDAGEVQLSEQIPSLAIVDRCRCGDDFCATFYVQPKPEKSYGPGLRNVALTPEKGMLILDVVDEKIMAIEVLYRDDVRTRLTALVP